MRITCPFCYAQVLGTEIPLECPHCGTKFEDDDDFNIQYTNYEKSWMEKSLKLEIR